MIYVDIRHKSKKDYLLTSIAKLRYTEKLSNSSYLISKIPLRSNQFRWRLIKTDW